MKKLVSLMAAISCLLMLFGCAEQPSAPKQTTAPKATLPTVAIEQLGTIEEKILYNDNQITFKALQLVTGADRASVIVEVQNKSGHPICIAADDLIVNNITITDGFSLEVAAGSTLESRIDVTHQSMTDAYIGNIVTLEGRDVRLFETKEYKTLDTFSFKLTTSAEYEQTFPEKGKVYYSANGFIVTALPYVRNIMGATVRILVTNNGSEPVNFRCEKATVDGQETTALLYDTVYPGTSRYCTIHIANYEKGDISVQLRVHDLSKEQNLIAEIPAFTFSPL